MTERDHRVAATGTVALPAMIALAWPVTDPSGARIGAALAIAVLGAVALTSLWRGAAERGRGFLAIVAVYTAGASVLERPDEPEAALACVLGLVALMVHTFGWLAPRPVELVAGPHQRWSATTAVAVLGVVAALQFADGVPFAGVVAGVAAVPHLAAVEADRRSGAVTDRVGLVSWLAGAVALGALASATAGPGWAAIIALPAAASAVFRRVDGRGVTEALFASPARMLATSFVAISVWGTAVLAGGPAGSDRPISLVDAAFTAVSATCVNGLVVRDTGADFSWFGQLVILILTQIGGLGIMTFAAAAWVWTGRRMSLRQEATAADLLGPEARGDLEGALSLALRVTVVTEALTAAVLLVSFLRHGDDLPTALWRAVFTAVSAFCNAGFALQPDSLAPYRDDPWIMGAMAAAVTAGALGPGVIAAIPAVLRGRGPLQAQVILTMTAGLIVGPTVLYALLEWSASLADLSVPSKLWNAAFQVMAPRSSGFTSVDITEIQPPTWTMMCVLMFVGGSPGSTAGGVKTTAIAAVAAAAAAAVRGQQDAVLFGRRVSNGVVLQAVANISVGGVAVVAALLALQLTQDLALDVAIFEAISALGTVGLSIGGTAELDAVGKVIVMASMIAGRIGPLTVVMLLAERRPGRIPARPEGVLMVG